MIPMSLYENDYEVFKKGIFTVHARGSRVGVLTPTQEHAYSWLLRSIYKSRSDFPKRVFNIGKGFRNEHQNSAFIFDSEMLLFVEFFALLDSTEFFNREIYCLKDILSGFLTECGIPHFASVRVKQDGLCLKRSLYFDYVTSGGKLLPLCEIYLDISKDWFRSHESLSIPDNRGFFMASMTERIFYAMLSTHMDKNGLVIPPLFTRYQVAVQPLKCKHDETAAKIASSVARSISSTFRVFLSNKGRSFGRSMHDYNIKGVPLVIAIGDQEITNQTITFIDRSGEKQIVARNDALILEFIDAQFAKHERAFSKRAFVHNSTISGNNNKDNIATPIENVTGHVVEGFFCKNCLTRALEDWVLMSLPCPELNIGDGRKDQCFCGASDAQWVRLCRDSFGGKNRAVDIGDMLNAWNSFR